MRWNPLKSNLKPIQKITLTGLFIALAMIFQKILAINYIPALLFLRISFGGPAIIIFSSIFLGPFYGLVVGVFSDILGYFFLDPKMMGYAPQISAIYGVLGLVSCFIFYLFRHLKNDKIVIIVEGTIFDLSVVGVAIYFSYNYNLLYISFIAAIFLTLLFISTVILNKFLKSDDLPISPINISLSCFVIELTVMVIFGTLMKGWVFGFKSYPVILACQLVVLFINVLLNTWLITLFLKLTKRFYKKSV